MEKAVVFGAGLSGHHSFFIIIFILISFFDILNI